MPYCGLIEPSADFATVAAIGSRSRPISRATSHISFQKLIFAALKMLCEHLTNSASAGLVKVRMSPPKGDSSARRRSTVCGSRLAMTVIHGFRKSSAAETARRNSGFDASAKPSPGDHAGVLLQDGLHEALGGAGRDGGAHDDGVPRRRGLQRLADRGAAGGEGAQVVLVARVRRRQRQEDERVGLAAQVQLGAHVVAAALQLADAGGGNVDEGDLVPGSEEALPGGGPDDARTHDEDPRRLHGWYVPSPSKRSEPSEVLRQLFGAVRGAVTQGVGDPS